MIQNDTNWISGTGAQHISIIQHCVAIVMFTLRFKTLVTDASELTPFEHLIFNQNKQKDSLKVVPKVTSYINHVFNKGLPALCCQLLKKFADVSILVIIVSFNHRAKYHISRAAKNSNAND